MAGNRLRWIMQKVVRLLESSVEWIVLAIAVAYLGWVAYAYLLNDPVAKPLEGTMVNPGSVDSFIETHAAQRLADQMHDVEVPSFVVDDSTQIFDGWLQMDSINQPALASADFDYAPFDSGNLVAGNEGKVTPVTQLPTLPPAQPALVAAALNTLAPPAGAQGGGKNVRLVIAGFTLSWDELFKQWSQSFGGQPPRLTPADFQVLQIVTYRSEKIGDTWTDPQEVSTLDTGLPSYPKSGDRPAEDDYLMALDKQPNAVVAPAYPATVSGPTWKDPIQYLPVTASGPANPASDQGGAMLLPGAQGPQIVNTQYRGGGGGPPPGLGPPPGFGGPPRGYVPPSAPTPPPEATPTAVPPAPGTVDPVIALASTNPLANGTPVEQAKVNVLALAAKSPDLFVYIIDPTAEPGKTYRYQIVYKALNPLFNKAPLRAAKAAWVTQFDFVSPRSAFSPEIMIPRQTYVYCGKPQGPSKTAYPFDVFTWANGKWQKETFNVSLGDPIGAIDGSVDYSTGFSFVDERKTKNGTKTLIMLVDRDGTSEIRDAGQDATSKEHQEKSQWVDQQAAGAAGAASPTPAPGGPPGGAGSPPPGLGPPPGLTPNNGN
jgi:hypothetical protein